MTSNPCSNVGVTTTTNTAILSGALSGVPGPRGPIGCPEITTIVRIDSPTTGRYYITYSNTAAEIQKTVALHTGATPQVTWNIDHGSDFSGIGTSIFASDQVTASESIGDVGTTFVTNSEDVTAGSHIWLDISAVQAGTDSFILILVHKPDCVDSLSDKGVYVEDTGSQAGHIPVVDSD